MAGDNTTKIVIELDLQIQNLKKQNKIVLQELEKLRTKTGVIQKGQKSGSKDHISGIEQSTKGIKRQTAALMQQEHVRAKNAKNSHKDLDEHKKKLVGIGKFLLTPVGKFVGAFAMGSGFGALRGPVGRGGVAGAAGWAGSMVGRGISRAVGGVLGFALSSLTQAYQTKVQVGMARGGLTGLGTRKQFFGQRGPRGSTLGFNPIESAAHAQMIGRATGNIGATSYAQQAARATGMDVGEAAGFMGQIRQAGYGFGGAARGMQPGNGGPEQFQKVIALGMESGLENARIPEFLQGIGAITQAVGNRISGAVNVQGIAAFQAVLGRSGVPGFQGRRGMAVGAQLNQAIQKPGGGEAGQSIMLQALGFGKPGGGTDYYTALKQQQEGLNRPQNIAAMFKEVYSQLGVAGAGGKVGSNQEANIALSEMTGLGLQQIEDLGQILNSGKSVEEQMKEINELTKGQKSVADQSLEAMKEFGGEIRRVAGKMETMATAGQKMSNIFTTVEKYQLKAMMWLAERAPELEKWLRDIYILLKTWLQIASPITDTALNDKLSEQKKKLYDLEAGKAGAKSLTSRGEFASELAKTAKAHAKTIRQETAGRLTQASQELSWSATTMNPLNVARAGFVAYTESARAKLKKIEATRYDAEAAKYANEAKEAALALPGSKHTDSTEKLARRRAQSGLESVTIKSGEPLIEGGKPRDVTIWGQKAVPVKQVNLPKQDSSGNAVGRKPVQTANE